MGISGGLLITSSRVLEDDCAMAVIGSVVIVEHELIMTVSGRTIRGGGSSDDDLSM